MVNVCDYNKALALTTFLSRKHEFGETTLVEVKVMFMNQVVPAATSPVDIDQAQVVLRHALEGNKYFVKAYSNTFEDEVFAEFTPSVIQYSSEDYRDFYQNTNLTAADAFNSVFNFDETEGGLRIRTTTSLINVKR